MKFALKAIVTINYFTSVKAFEWQLGWSLPFFERPRNFVVQVSCSYANYTVDAFK